MTRFEIEEIIRQDPHGVTFRALDLHTKQIVSLRRFFPFGQVTDEDQEDETIGGLDPQEGKAFTSACERLSKVNHPSLRKVIYGGTDPVDGMPYLVTEWIEGKSIAYVLGGNFMEPSVVMEVVRQALNVSIVLSESLKDEAVWVDTNPESIIVNQLSEPPNFSFRICPFKWLGIQSQQKDLTGIVNLVENIIGWKNRLVSDQAGYGLGGWLKSLRQNPQMSLRDALQSMPSGEIPDGVSSPAPSPGNKAPYTPIKLVSNKQSFWTPKSISIMAVSALVTTGLIVWAYNNKNDEVDTGIVATIDATPEDQSIKTVPNNPSLQTSDTQNNVTPLTIPETKETTSEKIETNLKTTNDPKDTETTAKETEKITKTTAGSTPWSPSDMPSLAWYDASTATIKDGTVTINNAGSAGGSLSGPASLTANGIGSLQAVQLNGSDQYLTGDLAIKGESLTVFCVGKSLIANQPEYVGLMSIYDSAQGSDWNHVSGAVLFSQNKTTANSLYTHRNVMLSSSTGTLTNGFLAGTVFNGSANTFYLNGVPSTAVASTGSFNSNKVVIGARWQVGKITGTFWYGNLGEVMVFNSELSASDRQKIEGYLAHKWNLTGELPANHPYKSSSPTSSSSKTDAIVNLPTKQPPAPKLETIPQKETITQKMRLWTPEEIETTAWYDAADTATLTAQSGTVSQWWDKSGNGLHLSQPKAANQPATGAKINNVNALDFTGDIMSTSKNPFGSSINNAFVIAAHRLDSIKEGTLFSLTGSDAHPNRWNAQAPWVQGLFYFDCGGVTEGTDRVTTLYKTAPAEVLLTSFYCSKTDNVQEVYKNGSLFIGDKSGHTVATVGNISVGGVGNTYQDTTLGEFIIINGTVDKATRQKLEGYLAHKWKTTASLPADHPYKSSAPLPSVLTAGDVANIKTLKDGESATIKGVVRSAKLSSTGKSIYLSFSEPEDESNIRVVIHESEFEGTPFQETEFSKLIGKDLVFEGIVYRENFNDRPPFVKITNKQQIKLAPKESEKDKRKAIYSPDDAETIAKMELKEPASVRGVVKSVRVAKPGSGLYFSFSEPYDDKQIRVVTYEKVFEGGPYDSVSFQKIETEFQHLVGKTVTFNGVVNRHQNNNSSQFIYITKRDQIVIDETTDNAQNESKDPNQQTPQITTLDDINPGTKVKIAGLLKLAKLNNEGNAIIMLLSSANKKEQLRGVVYKVNYEDEFDTKKFAALVGKKISLDGVLIMDGNKDKYVEITKFNQVTVLPN